MLKSCTRAKPKNYRVEHNLPQGWSEGVTPNRERQTLVTHFGAFYLACGKDVFGRGSGESPAAPGRAGAGGDPPDVRPRVISRLSGRFPQ